MYITEKKFSMQSTNVNKGFGELFPQSQPQEIIDGTVLQVVPYTSNTLLSRNNLPTLITLKAFSLKNEDNQERQLVWNLHSMYKTS